MFPSVLKFSVALILLLNFTISSSIKVDENQDRYNASFGENCLAAQLLALLDHYKQDDSVGIPKTAIPDIISVPDISEFLGMARLEVQNIAVYGLSNFRIKTLDVDLQMLKAHVIIQLDNINMIGDYTLGDSAGPFNVTLKDILVFGNVSLMVDFKGSIKTKDIEIDITVSDMSTDFQNMGNLKPIFELYVNSSPEFYIENIKPYILVEIYTQIRMEVDANIAKLSGEFQSPTSISSLDMAMAECRRYVRNMGWDPYEIGNYSHKTELVEILTINTLLRGLSTFYRFGKMAVTVENNIVSMHFQLKTPKILGSTQWSLRFLNGISSATGLFEFTVQHIQASIDLHQLQNTKRKAKIGRIKIDLGNIQFRNDGNRSVDFLREFGTHVLPNILRDQITDWLNSPIRRRIQEKLDRVVME